MHADISQFRYRNIIYSNIYNEIGGFQYVPIVAELPYLINDTLSQVNVLTL